MPVRRSRRDAPEADEYAAEEEPRSRRRRDEPDEDEKPTRRRRPARDDDDEQEEEKPTRRRRPADDDEEDEKPRRSRRSRSRDDDEAEDEDENEEAAQSSTVQAGWKAAKKVLSEGGDFASEFKFSDEEVLVKFMQDAPFASYKQHWLNDRDGKKSFVCASKGCPLCEKLGDRPSSKVAFNVLVLSGDDEGEVKALIAGSRLLTQIEKHHKDPKKGPIDAHFWSLSRSGKKGSYSTSMQVVKARDLADDWELTEREVEDMLDEAKPYGPDIIRPSSKSELRSIAQEYDD